MNTSSGFRTEDLTINGNATKSGNDQLSAARITQIEGALTLDSGVLALTGEMFSEDEYITGTPAPWAHLDASDYANSMQTATDENGEISVTSWSDISTNGFTATAPGYSTPPTLVTNGLNGLPYVDFGTLMLKNTTGSHLIWNTTNANMRTVVMVYSDSTNYLYSGSSDIRPCFLGRMYSDLQFWRGSSGSLIERQKAASVVAYGHMAVDGKAATPETYLPVGFHVLSFVTQGAARSEVFGRDNISWSGGNRLAEVMIWNQPLTSSQLRSVEQNLMVKWLGRNRPGYPARLHDGPAVGPWMHVDASEINSMELVEDSGTLFVQQWNDVRTNGVFAASLESSFRPVWRAGNGFPYVDFGQVSGPKFSTPMGQHLCWSETNSSIRAVFLVISDADSGRDQNFIGCLSGELPYYRGYDHTFFDPIKASPYVVNGLHSLDYGFVDGTTTPLPRGFHVIGIAAQRGRPVVADVFARDREYQAGGQKLAEVLVYNRELSDAEFRQTRRYLMLKWFGIDSQQESELHHLIGSSDATLDIGAGQTLTCQRAECPGTLEKRGAGRVIIGCGSAASISVPDGEVWLNEQFTNTGGGMLSNLVMGANATVNLNGNSIEVGQISAAGAILNGTVTTGSIVPGDENDTPQTLNLTGDLVLSSPCVISVTATSETIDNISVSGNLTLPAGGKVIVSIAGGARMPNSHTLFTFETLSGGESLASWTVELPENNTYTAKLVQNVNSIDLNFCVCGTLLMLK